MKITSTPSSSLILRNDLKKSIQLKFSILLVLIYLMFFGNVNACVDPKWEQFMRNEKYNEALNYLDSNEKEIVHNYSQFCYDYFKAESYYQLGQLEKAYAIIKSVVDLNSNSHKENPKESKKAVFYAIELAELYFSENNIDKSFEAADWATARGNYDTKFYINNKEIDATGRLAELMGDLWVKKGNAGYAKLYYNAFDLSKYSAEIRNKRAFANGELPNYSIPQKTYTQPIITENLYLMASATQNIGECKEGDCINGYGRFVYPDGKTYTGYWKNGKREGKGTTYEKGIVVNGYWKNDKWFEYGCLTGDCENGIGTFIYEGTCYTGQFKKSREDGEGTLTEKDGTTYKGQWEKGIKKGEGTETDPDGITLTGNWDTRYLEGPGIETLPNGYYKKAIFKSSNCCGKKEKFYSKDNVEISYTVYSNLKKNTYSTKKDSLLALVYKPRCISGNCENGYGVLKYLNGDRYFGYTFNGKREGLGFVWYADVVTEEYVSLTSLAKKKVTTLGDVSYAIWENDILTKSFDREDFYGILKINPYYGGLWQDLGERDAAEGVVLAQKEKAENDAAMGRYYNDLMKNVSFSSGGSSGSSNSTSGNGTGDAKMPDIVYKTVGGSSTIIYTHKN